MQTKPVSILIIPFICSISISGCNRPIKETSTFNLIQKQTHTINRKDMAKICAKEWALRMIGTVLRKAIIMEKKKKECKCEPVVKTARHIQSMIYDLFRTWFTLDTLFSMRMGYTRAKHWQQWILNSSERRKIPKYSA